MATKEWVAVFIKPKTRIKLKVRAAQAEMTFDEYINSLMANT